MKLKSEFVLRNFADKWIVVSVNDSTDSSNVFISMNSSGAFVWELLQHEISYDEVIEELTDKYDVDEATAKADFDEFLNSVRQAGMLCE